MGFTKAIVYYILGVFFMNNRFDIEVMPNSPITSGQVYLLGKIARESNKK